MADATSEERWYLKIEEEVSGPFPLPQIARHVVLGKLAITTPVSQDGKTWQTMKSITHLRAALIDARAAEVAKGNLAPRSANEEALYAEAIYNPPPLHKPRPRWQRPLQYLGVFVVIACALALALLLPDRPPPDAATCDAPPAPAVNWSYCRLEGLQAANSDLTAARIDGANLRGANLRAANLSHANLAYSNLANANLRGARFASAQLKGANLRGADLSGANFEGADLSYADLSGSQRDRVNWAGADLSHAQWETGTICKAPSIGECLR
jgi:hypothetical protein